jgi:hypothetical protein
MLTSRPLELMADAQRILAAWVTKIVMVADYLDRAHSVIQQRERTHLMNNLTPPPGWHIWIASYGGTQWRELAIFQQQGALEIPSINGDTATPHNLELTTIGIADLLFLAINSTWDQLWDVLENIVGERCRFLPTVAPLARHDHMAPLDYLDRRGRSIFYHLPCARF